VSIHSPQSPGHAGPGGRFYRPPAKVLWPAPMSRPATI